MHHWDFNEMHGEKQRKLRKDAACCFEQILEAFTLQKSYCTATNLQSHNPSKKDKQDIVGTTWKVSTYPLRTFSYVLLDMDTAIRFVRTLDAVCKAYCWVSPTFSA